MFTICFYKILSLIVWKDIDGKTYHLAPSPVFKKTCRPVTSLPNRGMLQWS